MKNKKIVVPSFVLKYKDDNYVIYFLKKKNKKLEPLNVRMTPKQFMEKNLYNY